jgi:hypothetical protein
MDAVQRTAGRFPEGISLASRQAVVPILSDGNQLVELLGVAL